MPDPSQTEALSPAEAGTQDPPRTLGETLRRLGPGMIVAGSIVGSGELIATTKLGAVAGFWLLWLIIAGCVIKVFVQVEFGRYTVTWGQTTLQALDRVPGPRLRVNWLLWYWLFMTVLVITQQGGIVGGVGQALTVSRPLTEEGTAYNRAQEELVEARVALALSRAQGEPAAEQERLERSAASLEQTLADTAEPHDAALWAGLLAVVTALLLYVGHYRFIQAAATVLVAAFTLVTLVTLVLLQTTDWAVQAEEVARGLRFALPPAAELPTNPWTTALAAFGLIGLGSGELIMYPYWCLEKGYARFTGPRDGSAGWVRRARGWMRVLYTDAWTAMAVYTFATIAFYLLGAAVLWRSGLDPEGQGMIRTLAEMYVPVFGPWAEGVFLFGAFAVLYSTFFVVAASFARIVADGLGLFGLTDGTEAARQRWTRRLSVAWPLVAALLYAFLQSPVAMVLASGIAQAIMLPMLAVAALYFRYRCSEPSLRPGRLWDAMLWFSLAGFLAVGGWSLYSVFAG